MLTVSFSEFRKHSSEYLDEVEAGETVTIIRHSKPVAIVNPIMKESGRIPAWKRPRKLLDKKFSLSETIIQERNEH